MMLIYPNQSSPSATWSWLTLISILNLNVFPTRAKFFVFIFHHHPMECCGHNRWLTKLPRKTSCREIPSYHMQLRLKRKKQTKLHNSIMSSCSCGRVAGNWEKLNYKWGKMLTKRTINAVEIFMKNISVLLVFQQFINKHRIKSEIFSFRIFWILELIKSKREIKVEQEENNL